MTNNKIEELIAKAEKKCQDTFQKLQRVALFNQEKVLNAFKNNRVGLRNFAGTTGYGYDDIGRDTLNTIFAEVFGGEDAIVSPNITCGSHALKIALFGLLRPGETMLSISGKPYDTLDDTIFGTNKDLGSLRDWQISYKQIDLIDGYFDETKILNEVKNNPAIIYIQRSKGYEWRDALSIKSIENIINKIRKINTQSPIVVDNCYGEFVDTVEPTQVGANIIIGSLIKNPGGGLAPTGGYIVGDKNLIEKISASYTSPSLLKEVGSYEFGYRLFYQGLFLAPHTVLQSLKGSALIGCVLEDLGYEVMPKANADMYDIIRSIKFKKKDELIAFCQEIQKNSPVDSFVSPEPWDMPGYNHQVIMAAGTFVLGSSIELSCDAPIKEPYVLYLQGGLTYEHIVIALKECLKKL